MNMSLIDHSSINLSLIHYSLNNNFLVNHLLINNSLMNVVNLDIYVAVILTVIKNRHHCTSLTSPQVCSLSKQPPKVLAVLWSRNNERGFISTRFAGRGFGSISLGADFYNCTARTDCRGKLINA